MTQIDAAAVNAVLADIKDPENGRGLVDNGQITDVQASADAIGCQLALTTHSAPIWEEVRQSVEERLKAKFPGTTVEVQQTVLDRPPVRLGETHLRCKSVIAVGSGKGGVGKSTVATSLARLRRGTWPSPAASTMRCMAAGGAGR